nr:retrovirus-related Pol polyprotein from transposon TNT 1-94 [Tanacetum cinerariifolium]
MAILDENISQKDLNLKFLRSLPSEWNTHVVVWRNKPDLDTMSFDDLYNNFKIVEQEVKGTASSSLNSQNMAFVSSSSSTNEVNTTYGITVKDTDGVTDIRRPQKVADLSQEEKLRYDSDIRVVNIILLGLPFNIYTLTNHFQTVKEIWDRFKELMKGTEMTKQECESMLYDEFDKFTSEPRESIHSYYLRYAKLIKDMKMISMSIQVTVQNVQGRQSQAYASNAGKSQDLDARVVNTVGNAGINQPRVIRCYNYNGKGHIAKSCTAKKMLQDTSNFKAGHVDAYDPDCNDEATANAIFMATLSPIGSINDDTVDHVMILTYSLSNVISYAKYMVTIGNDEDNYVPPRVQNNPRILSVIKDMKTQLETCNMSIEIILWYLDSCCSKHMTVHHDKLINFVSKFIGTVRFGNNHFAVIMGYGDVQIGNILISRVYCVEGLGHNLFSIGKFGDSNLKVAFKKHTCFVGNLEGVDLLSGSRGSTLYKISMADMMKSSPICLLSKASKIKSWLWHRLISHLSFGTINLLAKQGLVKGLPKLKYTKDHLCSACPMGKSKKESYPHKPEPSTNEKFQMMYMDLCGPMRVERINKKRYIIVIVIILVLLG